MGLILAEMCIKRPLLPSLEHLQVKAIVSKFGWPDEDFMATVKPRMRDTIEHFRPYTNVVPFEAFLPQVPSSIIELLKRILVLSLISFNNSSRGSAR